jgi:capping protein beta
MTEDTQGHHGSWNSIHVVQVIPAPGGRSAHYQLTSTILLELITQNPSLGQMDLAGNLTRQAEQDFPLEDFQAHVANMGRLIEDMETKMRNAIQDIYFGKTKDIVNDLRSITDLIEAKKQEAIKSELAAKLSLRKKT